MRRQSSSSQPVGSFCSHQAVEAGTSPHSPSTAAYSPSTWRSSTPSQKSLPLARARTQLFSASERGTTRCASRAPHRASASGKVTFLGSRAMQRPAQRLKPGGQPQGSERVPETDGDHPNIGLPDATVIYSLHSCKLACLHICNSSECEV